MGYMRKYGIRTAAVLLLALSLAVCVYSLAHVDGSSSGAAQTFGRGGGDGGLSFNGNGGGDGAQPGFGDGIDGSAPGATGSADGTPGGGDAGSAPGAAGSGSGSAAGASGGDAGSAPGSTGADGASGNSDTGSEQSEVGSAQGAPGGSSSAVGPDGVGGFAGGGTQGGGAPGFGRGGGFGASSSGAGKSGLVAYAFVFAALAAAGAYAVFRRKADVPADRRKGLLWPLLGAGVLLRIAVAPWAASHQGDLNFFRAWASQAAENLSGFYVNGNADYPPLYIYALYVIGRLLRAASLAPYATVLYKLPSMLADAGTAWVLFLASRRYAGYAAGLLVALLYLLNPAVIVNSTYWGQVDSLFTLLVVGAVYLLTRGRIGWASALFAAAILMKPQGIIFAPVLFFGLVSARNLRAWLTAIAASAATLLAVALPFSTGQSPLWLYRLYAGTVQEYPYATVNAYNLFALLGDNYKADATRFLGLTFHAWGLAGIVLTTLFAWRAYARSRQAAFAPAAAMLLISGVFTLSTGMHERYLFPAAALAALAYLQLRDRVLLWLAAGFSLTIFVNTFAILFQSGGNETYSFTMWAASTMNVALFGSAVLWAIGYVRLPGLRYEQAERTLAAEVLK
ncbi:DUF2029 domain-containing protein [Paenibacillus sp. MWE-103]|uniref:DUF2029 domain-containing protein n=1 Tax=Paenibacillus artemisiicola TaxID=1172618 RepID=A0ABS3WIB0_9BACL|nr:glycosyltransferase 87 family protein [Paenibacillus artemisiicola]MBO7747988.1 DUF2029 domain-containing protein [Paenibacillus artemisiicola]